MFALTTTFVIGAGASCELNLPSGDQLMTTIADLLSPSDQNSYGFANEAFCQEIRNIPGEKIDDTIPKIKRARDAILDALPWSPSIDNLLHNHQDDIWVERLGKAAIAWSILQAEKKSYFFPPLTTEEMLSTKHEMSTVSQEGPKISGKKLQESWYRPFAHIIFSQVTLADLGAALGRLRFVIFNYDRCFEHFLFSVIQDHYNVGPERAAEALENTTFVHPYGTLGALPWQSQNGGLDLGDTKGAPNIFSVGTNLRTFTESADSLTVDCVKACIRDSAALVFLGFGFLRQNIDLIRCDERSATQAYATAYGLSEPNKGSALTILESFLRYPSRAAFIEAGTCADLFRNYRMKLQA